MAPGRQPAGLELEPAVLAVARRRGLGQPDDPAFAEEVEPFVGKRQRALADAAVLPRDLAGVEVHRGQDGAVEAVEVIADEHRRRVVVLHLAREVDLLAR